MSKTASKTIIEEVQGVLVFVGTIWAVTLLSFFVPRLGQFGVVPRTFGGLVGIPFMPFLHEGLFHLISNTIPLIVLLVLLAGSRARSWEIVATIIGLSGALLWLVGRSTTHGHPAIHVGASGLVFGLATFLIVSGFLEKRIIPLIIAVVVALMYGSSLLFGMLPRDGISWDGHICGAIAGGAVAYLLVNQKTASTSNSYTDSPITGL